jgi:hypothetical protein
LQLFQVGGDMTILFIIAVVALVVLVTLSRGNGKLHILRTFRHRTILLVFVSVLLIYFMCYTTMWMQFTGAVRHPRAGTDATSSLSSPSMNNREGVSQS